MFTKLYSVKPRKWLSATSKLLWIKYPYTTPIYDSYVERALIVLQCLEPELASHPRIGEVPAINSHDDIQLIANFYSNYQSMIQALFRKYQKVIQEAKTNINVTYEFDIRILDKALWLIGNPKASISLNGIDCELQTYPSTGSALN